MNQSNYKYRVRADYWIDLPTIDNESEIFALKKQIEKLIEQESGLIHSISTEFRTDRVRVETCVTALERENKEGRVEFYNEVDDEWQTYKTRYIA